MMRSVWLVPVLLLIGCPSDDGDDAATSGATTGTGSSMGTGTSSGPADASGSTETGSAPDGSGDSTGGSGGPGSGGTDSGDSGEGGSDNAGGMVCGDRGTHSMIGRDGICVCEPGFAWCVPDDPNDYTCCEGKGMTGE